MSESMLNHHEERAGSLTEDLNQTRILRRTEDMRKIGRERLVSVFNEMPDNPVLRVQRLREMAAQSFAMLSGAGLVAAERILAELEFVTESDAFVTKGLELLEIVLEEQHADVWALDQAEYERFREQYPTRTVLNRFLEFDDEGTEFHLHVPPNRFGKVTELLAGWRQGMQGLARIVSKRPEVNMIVGKSWIVAEHPELLTRLGFRVYSDVEDKSANPHRAFAVMSRQDLLRRWLKEDGKG